MEVSKASTALAGREFFCRGEGVNNWGRLGGSGSSLGILRKGLGFKAAAERGPQPRTWGAEDKGCERGGCVGTLPQAFLLAPTVENHFRDA
jgi:hypothetical protein